MHKIAMCFVFLFNHINVNESKKCDVTAIEYNSYDYVEGKINLKVELYSNTKDVIEMSVYFYNAKSGAKYDIYYSSALNVCGEVSTAAKVPFDLVDEANLNIIFYSNNLKNVFKDITFPIYPKEEKICILSKLFYCESNFPTKVLYMNGNINEEYEKIALVNKDFKYPSFNNTFPLHSLKLSSTDIGNRGFATLYILDKIDNFELLYEGKYIFPLDVEYKKGIVSFSFANWYYLDVKNGKTYDEYKYETILDKQIIFPYLNHKYSSIIEIENGFSTFSKIILEFDVITIGNLYGNCKDSKYCLRRSYL